MKREWRNIMEKFKLKNSASKSLDKALFPGLLSKLIENLGMRAKTNLVSGFQTCGIYPCNENAVLKKFPEKTTDANIPGSNRPTTLISLALLEYLQQFKYSPTAEEEP